MRRYIRAPHAGATYFFTLTLEDRSSTALVDHVDTLRSMVAAVKQRHPFEIDAMVVLPDHIHAIWSLPEADADYAKRWMLVKQGLTKSLSKSGRELKVRGDKGERVFWQRRYWEHLIRDEEDLRRHIDYVHFNPVRHGLVARAADWPHSSFHRFVRAGRLAADWGLAAQAQGRFGE